MFTTPRGTKDILPPESIFWQKLEVKARKKFDIFGYSEIKTPAIEETDLFIRSLGQISEVVQKQIFEVSIHKSRKKDAHLCLRPEGTAGIIRSYIEHNLNKAIGFAKFYYIGPMFRAERPQRGRLRQFNHIGAEAIGISSPYIDTEIIDLATAILDDIGIKDYTVKLNSLGCVKDKKSMSNLLCKVLKPILKQLCPDCNNRFSRNVLRILDCKNKQCRSTVKNAIEKPEFKNKEYLCKNCLTDIETVQHTLKSLNIKYECDHFLVRGLDYYTKTVFEITHPNLGSQDAIGAGGRYDNLVKELGGPDVGAVGFALGIERIVLSSLKYDENNHKIDIFIVNLGEKAKEQTIFLLSKLRKQGISCDSDYENKSIKAQMRKANNLNAQFVCIIGEDELSKGIVSVKDMSSGKQEEIVATKFVETMKSIIQRKL